MTRRTGLCTSAVTVRKVRIIMSKTTRALAVICPGQKSIHKMATLTFTKTTIRSKIPSMMLSRGNKFKLFIKKEGRIRVVSVVARDAAALRKSMRVFVILITSRASTVCLYTSLYCYAYCLLLTLFLAR